MSNFSENLATLEASDHIQKIELLDGQAQLVAVIENIPGSKGSVQVYHHLLKKYGSISIEAAEDGLKIYAEHTADAETNPGKHPNIDRLFAIIKHSSPLTGRVI